MENTSTQTSQVQQSIGQIVPAPGDKKTSLTMLLGGIVGAVVILIGSFLLYTSFFKSGKKLITNQVIQYQYAPQADVLEQEASKIDGQMNEVVSLQGNIDQGLADQQSDLSE